MAKVNNRFDQEVKGGKEEVSSVTKQTIQKVHQARHFIKFVGLKQQNTVKVLY
jgi:hypothetical protein